MSKEIKTTYNLCNFFGVLLPARTDWFAGLQRSVYKNTACGASVSIKIGGEWLHHKDIPHGRIEAVRFHSIIEGFEAEVDSRVLPFPASEHALSEVLRELEEEVDETLRKLEAAESSEEMA